MAVQIIRAGQTVRVRIQPRSIVDTYIAGGYLYVLYSDGTTDNAGYVGGTGVAPGVIFANDENIYANSETIYVGSADLLGV